jgi:hypothetical protein
MSFWKMGLCVFLLAAGQWPGALQAAEAGNPYEYDVSGFTQVDPALIAYEEADAMDCVVRGGHGMAVGAGDEIAVAGEDALALLRKDGGKIATFALSGSAGCVAFLPSGELLVGLRDHVERVNRKGEVQSAWVGMGENAVLTSLGVGTNDVFLTDAGNRAVWRFDLEGRLKGRIGAEGGGDSHHFIVPSPYFDVVVRGARVWVVNPGRMRVEEYTADGRFVGQWGKPGMGLDGFCGCCNPTQLAMLPDGAFVAGEKGLARIKVLDGQGKVRSVVAAPGVFASDGPGCSGPACIRDLAVDAAGRILALDGTQNKIRVFVKKQEFAAASTREEAKAGK